MKMPTETKLGVLNPNLWSEISYKEFSKISKTRSVVEKLYLILSCQMVSNKVYHKLKYY